MRNSVVILGVVAACQAHDPAMQQKLDALAVQLAATQHDVAALRGEVEQRPAATAPPSDLERRLDLIEAKLDDLAAASQRAARPRPRRVEPDPAQVYAVGVDGYASEGPADAKVTMVLLFDYADPYTERGRDGRVELRKKYGHDLRIVYRNFVVHPQVATAAAIAGCAANKQHKFAEFDALAWEKGFKARSFDHDDTSQDPPQRCWETAGGCPVVTGFAKELHLDLARFSRDMAVCSTEVTADMADMKRFAIGATPTFFINGRYTAGAQPIENFTALIDEELAKANQRIAGGSKQATYYRDWVLVKGLAQLGTTP
jgi:protein-disulfide isomerase